MIKMFRDMNQPGHAYVLEAHIYLVQPKLDYAKAARLLQLGVDHNSPEAMYNLVRAFSPLPILLSVVVGLDACMPSTRP
jgi:TPR repeat protein